MVFRLPRRKASGPSVVKLLTAFTSGLRLTTDMGLYVDCFGSGLRPSFSISHAVCPFGSVRIGHWSRLETLQRPAGLSDSYYNLNEIH